MKKKSVILIILIFAARVLDLYTTSLAVVNFQLDEQNLLVKIFQLDMKTFFIIEILLAVLLIFCFIFYLKNKSAFFIKADFFLNYVKCYFFKKSNIKISDWFLKMNLKRILILFGSVIPIFIIITSIVFVLNNIWVYLFNIGNKVAVKYYLLFNDYYFFDFIIFVFPPFFLIYLLYKKLNDSYYSYN